MNIFKRMYEIHSVNLPFWLLTTTEIAVLNTVIMLVLSLLVIGVISYLPHHLSILADRAWYYLTGHETIVSATAAAVSATVDSLAAEVTTTSVITAAAVL